jgi:PhzF family phenazine biosynthesis protein
MESSFWTVDAFTDRGFSGNPAGVCLSPEPLSESMMKGIASEINLSETAFLTSQDQGFRLRWFTPQAEVDLCGHATLASAHILWQQLAYQGERIEFYTASGTLTATKSEDQIRLKFPIEERSSISEKEKELLIDVVGVSPKYIGASTRRYIVELSNQRQVAELQPNLNLLSTMAKRGLVVTSKSSSAEFDIMSRYFAPKIGIPEDPVTGSAHCALADYWCPILGRNEFIAFQASARGGILSVKKDGFDVYLSGKAVTMFSMKPLWPM